MFVAEPNGSFFLRLHGQVLTRESEDAYKTPPPVPGLWDMRMRSLIAFAVVIAVQALAGCDMPAQSGVTHEERSPWRKAELEVREASMRRQVEAGTFGLAQLFPGGMPIEARHLPRLPRPSAVPIPVVRVRVAKPSPSETPVHVAFAAAAGQPGGCVYTPIMSDADVDACR